MKDGVGVNDDQGVEREADLIGGKADSAGVVQARRELSNSIESDPIVAQALEAAIQDYGCPRIMNTDQGVQFTGEAFTTVLKDNYIPISMDGKGCYYDNIFVERLWRTVKYEHLYTREFNNLKEVRRSLNIWFKWYNQERFHQSLDDRTPDEVYYQKHAIPQAV